MADPKRPDEEALTGEDAKVAGLEGAAEEDAGFLRHAEVERGDEVSIAGSPPSAAGGEVGSPVPTRDDIEENL